MVEFTWKSQVILLGYVLAPYDNWASFHRELKCIRLEILDDSLQSDHVWADYIICLADVSREVIQDQFLPDSWLLCFETLYVHDFIYGLSHVKIDTIFWKFFLLNLWKVKQVIVYIYEKFCACHLDFHTIFVLVYDVANLLFEVLET